MNRMYVTTVLLISILGLPGFSQEKWNPPKNPEPGGILDEARTDADSGRYEAALAKHVWIHEHALKIDPSYYGVRLSFALSDWKELADKYPPALEKLKEIRDASEKRVVAGKDVRQSFIDIEAINSRLGASDSTLKIFKTLDKDHSERAKLVSDVAVDMLIQAKEYKLLGKYVKPERYDYHLQLFQQLQSSDLRYAKRYFKREVGSLVAILALTDRQKKAKEIADSAILEYDNRAFKKILDAALEGKFPSKH